MARSFFSSLVARKKRQRCESPRAAREAAGTARRLGFEPLEKRLLLTVTSSFNSGTGLLTVSSNAADNIALSVGDFSVLINGAAPGTGNVAASAVTGLSISAGPGGGTIDLSQLGAALPNLTSGQIQGSGTTTLVAPLNLNNVWSITGQNQGVLDLLQFQGVQNLTGGSELDTFVFQSSSATISGTINEPAGGKLDFTGHSITLSGPVITQGGSVSLNDSTAIYTSGSVTIQGSIYTQGGALSVYADTITVNDQLSPVVISTRDLVNVPGNPASDSSVGNSGNISLTGINITLSTNTASQSFGNQTTDIYSQVDAGSSFTAGTVNVVATEIAGTGSGNGFNFPALPAIDVSGASITLNAVAIYAGDVNFAATASSLHATTDVNQNTPVPIQTSINTIENFSLIGGLADSTSNAAINLGSDSSIVAASFTGMSIATSDAEVKPMTIKVGVAIAIDNTSAILNAAGRITTKGDTTLDALATNTLASFANAGGNVAGAGAAVAVSVENSVASSTVASTGQIRADGDLTVQASTTNNKALQAVTTTGNDGMVGVGVGISYANDTTTAAVNGDAKLGGDALVQANEIKNGFLGSKFFFATLFTGVAVNVGVGTDDTGDLINNMQGPVTQALLSKVASLFNKTQTDNTPQQGPAAGSTPPFQAAAATAIDSETNVATATIGPGASVQVAGNLSVDANLNDRPNVIASSGVSSPSDSGGGGGTEFDGSVAVALGFYTNTANATIDNGASVDAGKKLAVTSEALNDFQYSVRREFHPGRQSKAHAHNR